MTATYRNPWFTTSGNYGPEFYKTDAKPVEYRGFQIFQRIPGAWELVKDGVCLTQRAGKQGPRNLADALLGDASDDMPWLVERARGIAERFGVKFQVAT